MMDIDKLTAGCAAHRACCGAEHDPSKGRLHGFCIVCGVPWPCEVAVQFMPDGGAAARGDTAKAEPMVPLRLVEEIEKAAETYIEKHHCMANICQWLDELRAAIRAAREGAQ